MTDVLKTSEKNAIRRALIAAAVAVVEKEGWTVGKEASKVRGRVRTIRKNGRTLVAAIRTSQDHWIAFPRNRKDTKWLTLADVDVVVAGVVDDPENPKVAQVHLFDAKELRERFDRAYAARNAAGHTIKPGRGMWVSLYHEEGNDPVNRVGGGIGLAHPAIGRVPLDVATAGNGRFAGTPPQPAATGDADDFAPLTIAQAKIRLARTLGVEPSNVKITIEG